MNRQERTFSPKKRTKNKVTSKTIDLETVCYRLNQIIERSNAIDEIIGKYEKQQNKKNVLQPITLPTDSISTFNQYSIKSRNKTVENTELSEFPKMVTNDQSKISSITKNKPISINSLISSNNDDSLTLETLYDLMLELKQQINSIAENQKVMQKEIEKLNQQKNSS